MPLANDIQRRQLEIAIAALKVVAERLGLGILEDKESKS